MLDFFGAHFRYDNFHFLNSMISENMLRLFHYTLLKKNQELNEKCKSYERILQSVHKFMNHTLIYDSILINCARPINKQTK